MSLRQITLRRLKNELPVDVLQQLIEETIGEAWTCRVADSDPTVEQELTTILFKSNNSGTDWMKREIVWNEKFIRLILSQVLLGTPEFSDEIFYIFSLRNKPITWKNIQVTLIEEANLKLFFNKNNTDEFIKLSFSNFSNTYNPEYHFNDKEEKIISKNLNIDYEELIDFIYEDSDRFKIMSWAELFVATPAERERDYRLARKLLNLDENFVWSRDSSPRGSPRRDDLEILAGLPPLDDTLDF